MRPRGKPARAGSGFLRESGGAIDCSLLPGDKSFSRLLPAFLFPYLAYVGLGSLPPHLISPEGAGLLRFAVVAALLAAFRGEYRFGARMTVRQMAIAFAAAAAAFAIWVVSYRLSLALPWWHTHIAAAESSRPTTAYWILRSVNSVLLVPVFEELFCRAYLSELFIGASKGLGGFFPALGRRMDAYPEPLGAPPISTASVIGSTALFTLGHDVSAWIPAMLYFGFTTWVYARTRSFRLCMAVHALTNLAIAAVVWRQPAMQFLWF